MHVVTGKSQEPDADKLRSANIPVDVIHLGKKIDLAGIRQIREILSAQRFDIVHAFNNKTISNALIACRGFPIKFIAYRGIVGNVSFFSPNSWLTYLNPNVDRIVCVAEAIREHLLRLQFLGLRIPADKLVTIHKGHDMAWYQQPPADLTQFGVPKDAFVVGCTANFRPRKGLDVLIRALDELPADTNIHLLLVGHMDNSRLNKLINNSAYRDKIHLSGYQHNAPEIIAACNVCVLPSIKREGLPKSVIEGMAYGVAPIVTDSGGSPELIEPNVSGLLVPPRSSSAIAEAILQLLHDPELCQSIGNAARERIQRDFNIQQTIAKTYVLYQELLENQ